MTRGPQETKKPAAKATAAGEGRPRATGKPRAGEPKPGETRAEAVAAYLRQHPDFFVGRAALFDSLRLPGVAADREGRVLDLRAAMLERLRGELSRMVAACDGGSIGECRVMQVIGDHALCAVHRPEDAAANALAAQKVSVASVPE